MKFVMTTFFAVAMAGTALAGPIKLSPANPQPGASDLSPGLAVSYAADAGGRTLSEAKATLRKAIPGTPLIGLSYLDGNDGDKTLTSDQPHRVAAAISGYIRFDAAGTFEVEFLSNDGLEASIGGQQVVMFDGVHSCEPSGAQQVVVPSPGWYELEATYFQRKGSACLMMDWNVGGAMEPVPDSVFAH